MTEPTFAEATASYAALKQTMGVLRRLLVDVLGRKSIEPDDILKPFEFFAIRFFDWATKRLYYSADEIASVVRRLAVSPLPEMLDSVKQFWDDGRKTFSRFDIVFSDFYFVVWPGRDKFFHVVTMEDFDPIPWPPVEKLALDATALYITGMNGIIRIRGDKHGSNERPATECTRDITEEGSGETDQGASGRS